MHLWGWLKFTFLSAKTLNDVGNGAYLDRQNLGLQISVRTSGVVIRPPMIHGTLHFILIHTHFIPMALEGM